MQRATTDAHGVELACRRVGAGHVVHVGRTERGVDRVLDRRR